MCVARDHEWACQYISLSFFVQFFSICKGRACRIGVVRCTSFDAKASVRHLRREKVVGGHGNKVKRFATIGRGACLNLVPKDNGRCWVMMLALRG